MLVVVLVECLAAEVAAAAAEPSLVVLQVLRDLIQENPWILLEMHSQVMEVPLEFPDFQELECQPFPVGTG